MRGGGWGEGGRGVSVKVLNLKKNIFGRDP